MSKYPDQVGPDSDPYLDRLEPEEWQDEPLEDDDEECVFCKGCRRCFPIDEMQDTPNGFLCSMCE